MEYTFFIWVAAIIAVIVWARSLQRRTYNFIKLRNYFFGFSAVLITGCLITLFTKGVVWGLDFTGGTIIEAGVYKTSSDKLVDTKEIDELLESYTHKFRSPIVQTGADLVADDLHPDKKYQRLIVRVTDDETGEALSTDEARELYNYLQENLGEFKELRIASIGPTISGELTQQATLAIGVVLLLQLIYIFLRFQNQLSYGITADIALIHDVIIMLGFYSLAGEEIDSPFVAALLTVVGYSVMDSVVIFDRIRENRQLNPREPYAKVVNDAINQTMTRSINTTLTTLVSLLAIYYYGGSTLQNFAFALLVGIVTGAYSSIFIAGQTLVVIDEKQGGQIWNPDSEEFEKSVGDLAQEQNPRKRRRRRRKSKEEPKSEKASDENSSDKESSS